jgi:hypothetical protein
MIGTENDGKYVIQPATYNVQPTTYYNNPSEQEREGRNQKCVGRAEGYSGICFVVFLSRPRCSVVWSRSLHNIL